MNVRLKDFVAHYLKHDTSSAKTVSIVDLDPYSMKYENFYNFNLGLLI